MRVKTIINPMIRRTLINHHLLRTNIERIVKQIVRRTYTDQGV